MSLMESSGQSTQSIEKELGRQRDEIELIASENIVSRAVLEAQGSVMTNKYAEGYPGRRYYGGCQFVDIAENSPSSAPSSCSAADLPMCSRIPAARPTRPCSWRWLQPGDTILGMSLDAGGHLTHGAGPTSRASGSTRSSTACASQDDG
jgi:glycine hydroxymethyltransferase